MSRFCLFAFFPYYICVCVGVELCLNSLSLSALSLPICLSNKKLNTANLDLANNRFVGELPPQLGNLTQLDRALLSGNDFVGAVPESLCLYINETFSFLQADCHEVECPCCRYCCNDTVATTTAASSSCVCVAELQFLC